jgi:hypothetical protein
MISPSAVKLSYADSMLEEARMFPARCSLSAITCDTGSERARKVQP